MKCNAMKNFLADVYGNKKGAVEVAEESHKTETCDFSLNDYAKTEVCSECEKGCKLSTQIVYRWPGFLVAQPIINGWVVASYLDEKNVLQSAEIALSRDRELTKEEVANAYNATLQNARKIVSILWQIKNCFLGLQSRMYKNKNKQSVRQRKLQKQNV